MSTLIEIGNALEKGKKKLVVQYVQQALEEGHSAQEILTEGLLPGMDSGDVLVVLILLLLLSEGNEDSGSVLMTLAIFLFLQ